MRSSVSACSSRVAEGLEFDGRGVETREYTEGVNSVAIILATWAECQKRVAAVLIYVPNCDYGRRRA